ncbi:hypothetical protein TorRG33x02_290910 [Trema orientale]|uniref:Transmembrane protein n=1 Tax=Trema orientale TaxID=63057 RepID=A0A2P5CBQ9_TREOI|nr:hypothetical protein TorRG33x02_290910 [Trema orientale]
MIYSYSAPSLPSFSCTPNKYPSLNRNKNNNKAVQSNIIAQSFRDHHEGPSRSSNNHIVDANLSVLRERMEEIKVKEKLERCCRREYGWNYAAEAEAEVAAATVKSKYYRLKRERDQPLTQLLELAAIVGGTLGITFFSGTFFLCLVSLFVHLNQSL